MQERFGSWAIVMHFTNLFTHLLISLIRSLDHSIVFGDTIRPPTVQKSLESHTCFTRCSKSTQQKQQQEAYRAAGIGRPSRSHRFSDDCLLRHVKKQQMVQAVACGRRSCIEAACSANTKQHASLCRKKLRWDSSSVRHEQESYNPKEHRTSEA